MSENEFPVTVAVESNGAVVVPNAAGVYEIALQKRLTERRRVVVTDAPVRSWRVESQLIPVRP